MAETNTKPKRKKRSVIWKVLKITLLFLLLTFIALFLIFKDRDIATDLVSRTVIRSISSAGLEADLAKVSGNPWRGYSIEGLNLASPDIFNARIGEITVDLNLLKLITWDPVEKIGIYNSKVNILDPARMSELKPESSDQKKITLPPLPLEISSVDIIIPEHQINIGSADIYHSSKATSLALSGSVDILPFEMEFLLNTGEKRSLEKGLVKLGKEGIISLSGDISPTMDIAGLVQNINLSELSSLDKRLLDAEGIFNATIHSRGTIDIPEGKGDFSLSEGRIKGSSIGSISGKWSYLEDIFRIEDLENEILGSTIEGDLSIDTSGKLTINADGKNLDLASSGEISSNLPEMTGLINTLKLNASGTLPWLTGNVKLASEGFSISGQKFDSLNLDIFMKEKDILLDSTLSWSGTKAQAKGSLDLSKEPLIDLDIRAPRINLNILPRLSDQLSTLEPEGVLALAVNVRGKIKDPAIKGSLLSKRFSIRQEIVEDLNLSFSLLNGNLKINKMGASTLGGALSGSGKVSDIYDSPVLDLKFSGKGLDLRRASQLIPSPPEDLEGMTDLDLSIRGPVRDPLLEGTFNSSNFKMGELASAETISAKASIKGSQEPLFEISTPLATVSDFILHDLKGTFSWKAPLLEVRDMSLSLLGGDFSASGNLTTKPLPSLEMTGSFKELELEDLPFPGLPATKGTIAGNIRINGALQDPQLAFQVRSPFITSGCVVLRSINLQGDASRKKIDITSLSAGVGKGLLKGGMTLGLRDKGTNIFFNLVGSALDLASLLPPESISCPVDLSGNIDLQMQGDFTNGKLNGEGMVSSRSLAIQGFLLESLNIPLDITANKAEIKGLNISSFGGIVSGDLGLDLDELAWNATLNGEELDLKKALDQIPALAEKFSGKTFFDLTFKGRGFNPYGLFGYGLVEVRDGDIGGMPAIKAAAATAGEERIKFKRARSNFLADGFGITILGGSRVEAPRKYPLYRSIDLDGTVQYDGDLDLKGKTEVNIQALNAFLGTLQIALKTALSQGDLIQDLLGGLGGLRKKDFRTISFHLGGNRTSPEIKELQVEGGQEYLRELLDMEDADRDMEKNDNRQITIKLNFPVGPGDGKEDDTTGEQLKEQFLEGILKNLFPKE